MIFSGLEPIWYETDWLEDWKTWGASNSSTVEAAICERAKSLAAVVICSPNYAGLLSNITDIARICRKHKVALIVDEAHGAHLLNELKAHSALAQEADFVIHSMHKTLSAPTQTGVLHIGIGCPISDEVVRATLNTLQSSSPSYILMLGIEKALTDLSGSALNRVVNLANDLRKKISAIPTLEVLDLNVASPTPNNAMIEPLHVLVRHKRLPAEQFNAALATHGIYAEAVLGNGVLLLLGIGSREADLDVLIEALLSIDSTLSAQNVERTATALVSTAASQNFSKPPLCPQDMNPRQAFFANSCHRPITEAIDSICCDWIAPCPPGYPVLAPGQRITSEVAEFLEKHVSVRVVKNPQLQGDSDGPNTAS